ncbi:MAG: hypothetical protein D9N11_06575, partial [Ketobacter sp.]
MDLIKTVALLFTLSLVAACAGNTPPAEESYTPDSWQTMIPDTCTHFFDGCNKCTRTPGAEMAACTRMA